MPDDSTQFDEEAEKAAWASLQSFLPRNLKERQAKVFSPTPLDKPAWYLIVHHDGTGELECLPFPTFEELAIHIRTLQKRDFAIPIFGWLIRYSAAEDSDLRYLIHPSGQAHPLFDIPTDVRLSPTFFIQGYVPTEPGDEEATAEDEDEDDEPAPGDTPSAEPVADTDVHPVSEDLPDAEEGGSEEDDSPSIFPGMRHD